MKLLIKKTDYALQALVYIAHTNGKIVSTAELEKRLALPRPFLRKTLQELCHKKILKSLRGNKGGFLLAKSPWKIRLIKVMEIFQGKFSFLNCHCKGQYKKYCSTKLVIKNAEREVYSKLQYLTIADLL